MSRKPVQPDATPEATPEAPRVPAPATLPQGGGAFVIEGGSLVRDQDAAPPTRMPGADAPETPL